MVLVDAHVHMHECFDVARVFDAAAANFAAAARGLAGERDAATAPSAYDAVLCLVECRGQQFLDRVRARRTGRVWRGSHGFWEVEPGCEPETLVVRRGSTRLKLIAGRQLVTSERLEVLALGTTAPLPDGEPIETTLSSVRDTGAAAVLPWGVCKWLGARGAVVARVLADPKWQHVFLGDNGNRLELGPDPAPFAAARAPRRTSCAAGFRPVAACRRGSTRRRLRFRGRRRSRSAAPGGGTIGAPQERLGLRRVRSA